jgi:hypothetical protein
VLPRHEPSIDRLAAEANVATKADVRHATGAHLPVDPIGRHPDVASNVVGFEQPARSDVVVSANDVRLVRDRGGAVGDVASAA